MGAGNHHVARPHVPELEHVTDDFGLLVVESARHFAFGDDELDFGAGHGGRRLGAAALERLRDEGAQPERRGRKRRGEHLPGPEQPQKPRRPAFGSLRRGRLQHLGGECVDDHGSERRGERTPEPEPARKLVRDEHRRQGDADGPNDEPARFDDLALLDIPVERGPRRPLERVTKGSPPRSGQLGERPVGGSVERSDGSGNDREAEGDDLGDGARCWVGIQWGLGCADLSVPPPRPEA